MGKWHILNTTMIRTNSRIIWYDLETGFIRKGMKRRSTPVLEIGAVDNRGQTFHRLCDPFRATSMNDLTNVKGRNTVNFWKKIIQSSSSADVCQSLNIHITNNMENDIFLQEMQKLPTEEDAYASFVNWIGTDSECTLYAHNGKSFDHHISKGKHSAFASLDLQDTIPVFKKYYPGQASYSQPYLYMHLFGTKPDNVHRALGDALALKKLWERIVPGRNEEPNTTDAVLVPSVKTSLQTITSIGSKTEKRLNKRGVHSVQDLNAKFGTGELDNILVGCSGADRIKHIIQHKHKHPPPTNKAWSFWPVRGIGPRSETKLKRRGIQTVQDLWDADDRGELESIMRGCWRPGTTIQHIRSMRT